MTIFDYAWEWIITFNIRQMTPEHLGALILIALMFCVTMIAAETK